ncbi:UvrD-helicase domain-containing protein [Nocardiopsis sp. CT-R113]|uniref:DNA 3'-5' helicase n=1 Tax=Nocardiopsis codii TaxID=3065942 RepID=A0ABU7K8R4_9ACTN|nr:UvrD-helicase domain-containing protein [Nocardiopsis sp. CT-R113]MEE2038629.1 UvrD-helicase domain-containing protein [Nocardiopsis sp. CT-R113]
MSEPHPLSPETPPDPPPPPRLGPAELSRLLGQPEPTAEQSQVISAPLEPGVVIAGAGSGKSETMASRVVWLVANGHVRPEQILGLTFTRKATAELAERVRRRLEQLRATEQFPEELLDGEPTVSTYNAYAGRIVSDHALREAVEPTSRLLSQGQSWQIAARVVGEYDGPMDLMTVGADTVTQRVLHLSGEIADHLTTTDQVRGIGRWIQAGVDGMTRKATKETRDLVAAQRRREQLLPLVDRYNHAKHAREAMDFGDQMALAARIAEHHPEVGLIERGRYRVVLLDEYQDTSHAQLVLLRSLFGDGHPVTAVGDPCQSIYGWRGAIAANLTRFPTDFPAAPGRPAPVRRLSTSFRNGERVLRVAERISEKLRAEARDVPVLHPGPARRGRGTALTALFSTETEEAAWIADQVHLLVHADPGRPGSARTAPDSLPWPEGESGGAEDGGVGPGDVAVLCRKRSQFPPLREALEARGIPVEVVGLGGLMMVPEVRDIIATLRVVHDASAGNELARLLTGPRWRLGPRDLAALGARATELARHTRRDLTSPDPGEDPDDDILRRTVLDLTAESGSLVDAVDDPGAAENYSAAAHERLGRLAEELRALRKLVGQPLPDLVTEVERMLGLDIEVGSRTGRDPLSARADLDAFVDHAVRFVGNSEDPTLGSFLSYLNAAEENESGLAPGERVGGSDSVKLMTMHGAKGLQWPVVVVPGISGGKRSPLFPAKARDALAWAGADHLLPYPLRGDRDSLPRLTGVDKEAVAGFRQAERDRQLMEERRLAYVAVTRASFALVCTGHWWGRSGAAPRGPSVFLEEIREACEGGAGAVVGWAPPPGEDETNPHDDEENSAVWPPTAGNEEGAGQGDGDAARAPGGATRHTEIAEGAALVERARARLLAGETAPGEQAPPTGLRRRLQGWERDTELLLAHRRSEAAVAGGGPVQVELPGHLSVSSMVWLARDPSALARQIRRPLPRPPAPHTRRGTAFHTWLEQRFGQRATLLDELPGAADETAGEDEDLAELQRRFEQSEWGSRVPVEVEVPFETVIGDRLIRGRMDAVFHDAATGRHDVVDWKTGRPPGNDAERRAVGVQLAAYRLAWADLAGVGLEEVHAAFHYVLAGRTVRPADLLDAEGLAALISSVPEPG